MNNVFVYITLFFLKIKQIVNIKPKHFKLIQMYLQLCNQNICIWMRPQSISIWMCSWKMAFAFAFDSSETFAFVLKCDHMHLLTSLGGAIFPDIEKPTVVLS